MKVHLDTDIGGDVDDVCALAYLACHPDVELTGVTSVLDDGGRRAGYARELLRIAGLGGVPIAEGAREDAPRYHGQQFGLPEEPRYWPAPVARLPGPSEAALDLLEASIAGGAVVFAIGPYTNLALLEEQRPGILAAVDVVLMGGFVREIPAGYPQFEWTHDFNVQADADAAEAVLRAVNPARCTLVPIEVTVQTYLRQRDLGRLRAGDHLGALVAHQAAAFAEDNGFAARYGHLPALPDDLANFMHDPRACTVGLGWPGARIDELPLRLERHDDLLRLVEDEDAAAGTFRVVTEVDAEAFLDHWLEVVAG
ncbi:MAG: nucleoside hydrolase [Dehalococcoidia bacterium]|nr:nucleoside hydrolase [Dehalococcoidia bacterium]